MANFGYYPNASATTVLATFAEARCQQSDRGGLPEEVLEVAIGHVLHDERQRLPGRAGPDHGHNVGVLAYLLHQVDLPQQVLPVIVLNIVCVDSIQSYNNSMMKGNYGESYQRSRQMDRESLSLKYIYTKQDMTHTFCTFVVSFIHVLTFLHDYPDENNSFMHFPFFITDLCCHCTMFN